MELDSDGNGKFTAGILSERLADDTRRFGEKACTYELVRGEYRMTSADAGTSTIIWKLKPGSDGHCGGYPNLGRTESARDFGEVSSAGQFFTATDGTSRWTAASPLGVSIASCRRVR